MQKYFFELSQPVVHGYRLCFHISQLDGVAHGSMAFGDMRHVRSSRKVYSTKIFCMEEGTISETRVEGECFKHFPEYEFEPVYKYRLVGASIRGGAKSPRAYLVYMDHA